MDALRLTRYNHDLWLRFADFFVDECSWGQLSQDHATSHGTIANVTMHALNMEDWWLHYVLQGKEWDGPAWDGFTSAKAMRERVQEVVARTDKMLEGASEQELRRPRTVDLGEGPFQTTLEDVLTEVVNEATHHRGEVLAMLWRMDKEPPYVDFLTWSRTIRS